MLVIEPKNEDNKKPLQAFVIPFALTLGGALLAGATFWGAFAMAALGALSFAIQAKAPDMPTFDYGFGSEHFSFGDRPNTDGAGTAIPVVYGKHKVSGHRIHTKIDTWNNTEHVSVLLALSEGEIESISDIKINDKPYTDIVPADCIETRMGTAGQSIIEGFEEIANWNEDVSHVMCTIAEVVPYQHVHIYTTLAPVNSVKVKFLITDLYEKRYYAWDTKQISPYYAAGGLKYKVEARITGVGAYTELQAYTTINRYVKGSSSIEESEELSLSSLGPVGLYDIKVTFDLILGSCGITWDKLECWTYSTANYPNVALLSIRYIPAPKVGGQIPEITCLVEGRKVDIWNGAAWVNQYSENPAWCLLDLLTNLRYGLGAWVEDETIDIDKDSFKAWGAYCDEQVDDQTGTSTDEDRHKIGIVLDVQKNAWEWMNIIAMTGRAFMIKSGSEYKVIPDQATAVSQLFTVGNIIEGSFKGSYISAKEDFNLIKVHFNNSETTEEYDRDIVQYPLALAPGVDEKPKEIQLYGITRASHAQREALYQYNIGLATTMVIEFDCAIDSLSAEIGDVIGVQHDVTLWGYGGRIVNAYNDGGFGVIEIDRDDLPNDGVSTYKVLMRLQDDTVIEKTV